jgi:exodeoxyribonuclease VII large subunit
MRRTFIRPLWRARAEASSAGLTRLAVRAYLREVSDIDTAPAPATDGNAQAYSVSELAFALKRTLEDSYGFVRLRGEISKVTRHASGHCYLSLKDEKACIDGVVWKGQVRGLACQPEQGLEVIVTGRITTYPASSKYQIVIESMEPAGVGALLAQLERLKARLKSEGLFEVARKRPLPFMPRVIGVVTSPTGAVIRDILHRIRDRWPCHVVVWPVVVQGEAASAQVIAAIRGFNAIAAGHPVARPDVIIVARGGGSVEDLWAFNDEALARAVADSAIPLISAVGHETDTTLIDFVSDRRAPTPTAAAEMATPVLVDLRGAVEDYARRLGRCGDRMVESPTQRLDHSASRLGAALERNASLHERALLATAARFAPGLLSRPRELKARKLAELTVRLGSAMRRATEHERVMQDQARRRVSELNLRLNAAVCRLHQHAHERLVALDKLRLSVDPDRPLHRGFARVHRGDGTLARSAAVLRDGEPVRLVFGDGARDAVVNGFPAEGVRPAPAKPAARPKPAPPPKPAVEQGDLF